MTSRRPNLKVQDLGPNVIDGVDVHGFRRTMTIPAKARGTDLPVVVSAEIWYSEELSINLLTKQDDPRSGSLTMTVTQINFNEPDVDRFTLPPDYKLVDMTRPNKNHQKVFGSSRRHSTRLAGDFPKLTRLSNNPSCASRMRRCLECGGSSHRLPLPVHTARVQGPEK